MLVVNQEIGDRTLTVEVAGEQVEFIVGPEDFAGLWESFRWTKEQGLLGAADGDGISVGDSAALNYRLLLRVKGWRGLVTPDGQELPCTQETKLFFFGQYPGALFALRQQLAEEMEAAGKNSGTSPAG